MVLLCGVIVFYCFDQPQVAHIALTSSLQLEGIFLQRATSNCCDLFGVVEQALTNIFIPSLTALYIGHDLNSNERLLCALPIHMGGINIKNPITTADSDYIPPPGLPSIHKLFHQFTNIFSPVDHYIRVQQSKQEQSTIQKIMIEFLR